MVCRNYTHNFSYLHELANKLRAVVAADAVHRRHLIERFYLENHWFSKKFPL